MQSIPASSVRQWQTVNQIKSPTSISNTCPHCGEKVLFTLSDHNDDSKRLTIASTAYCPGCKGRVHFWSVRKKSNTGEDNLPEIFMYPSARNFFPTPTFAPDFPEALQRAFVSTIDAFNSKNYAATAVCGRRTLEGIFKFLVAEERRKAPLAQLIDLATKEVDLAAPLKTLSHGIRSGGNLGAHFDMENEPSEALARKIVELLQYLISYLYILPKEIGELEKTLSNS